MGLASATWTAHMEDMADDLPLDDPFEWFGQWFALAEKRDVTMPNWVTLATADTEGQPSARVVLLKSWDEEGFIVYTNLQSRKGREIDANPRAALCFYWDDLGLQIRVRGRVEQVPDAVADAYWATRDRGSQIGGWASHQSEPIASREALLQRVAELTEEHEGKDVPRPPHWSGLRVVPEDIEFWKQGEFRLHDRFVFTREGDSWRRERVCP
jgi:pyridoxamine 5'-phosphate oxidase